MPTGDDNSLFGRLRDAASAVVGFHTASELAELQNQIARLEEETLRLRGEVTQDRELARATHQSLIESRTHLEDIQKQLEASEQARQERKLEAEDAKKQNSALSTKLGELKQQLENQGWAIEEGKKSELALEQGLRESQATLLATQSEVTASQTRQEQMAREHANAQSLRETQQKALESLRQQIEASREEAKVSEVDPLRKSYASPPIPIKT